MASGMAHAAPKSLQAAPALGSGFPDPLPAPSPPLVQAPRPSAGGEAAPPEVLAASDIDLVTKSFPDGQISEAQTGKHPTPALIHCDPPRGQGPEHSSPCILMRAGPLRALLLVTLPLELARPQSTAQPLSLSLIYLGELALGDFLLGTLPLEWAWPQSIAQPALSFPWRAGP